MAKRQSGRTPRTEHSPEPCDRQKELKTEILGVVYLGLAVLLFLSLQMKETGSFGEAVRRVLYTVTGKKVPSFTGPFALAGNY